MFDLYRMYIDIIFIYLYLYIRACFKIFPNLYMCVCCLNTYIV